MLEAVDDLLKVLDLDGPLVASEDADSLQETLTTRSDRPCKARE